MTCVERPRYSDYLKGAAPLARLDAPQGRFLLTEVSYSGQQIVRIGGILSGLFANV